MEKKIYNIFCDESCHLENDDSDVMLLCAVTCLEEKRKFHNQNIRNLKLKHGMSSWNELKWVKVSKKKLDFYEDLIEYFKREEDLKFRVLVARHKTNLKHELFNNTHDDWYYKMYYYLLCRLIKLTEGNERYRIFLDIKDTNGGYRTNELTRVLCNKYRINRDVIGNNIQQVRSNESELMQLGDVLMGAIGYYHRGFAFKEESSEAKNQVIKMIVEKLKIDLDETTRGLHPKFDLFIWDPKELRGNVRWLNR